MTPRANLQKRSEQDFSDRDFVHGSKAENFEFSNAHEIVELIVSSGLGTIRDMVHEDYGLVIKVPATCPLDCTSESGFRASIDIDHFGPPGDELADDWWISTDDTTPAQYDQSSRASIHGQNWCIFVTDGSCKHNGKTLALDLFDLLGGELRGYISDFRSANDISAVLELNEVLGSDYSVDFDADTHEVTIDLWGNDSALDMRTRAWQAQFTLTTPLGPRISYLELAEEFNEFGIGEELRMCLFGWGWLGILFQLDPNTDAPNLTDALPELLGALCISYNPLEKPRAYDPPFPDVDSIVSTLGQEGIIKELVQPLPDGWADAVLDGSVRIYRAGKQFDPDNALTIWIECPIGRGAQFVREKRGICSGETIVADDGMLVTITNSIGPGNERTSRLANAIQDVLGGEVLYTGDPGDGEDVVDEELLDNNQAGA